MTPKQLLMWLTLAFVVAQSGVRLLVVPLWQHYDESTHYEYMRYLVIHGRPPDRLSIDDSILEDAGFTICQTTRTPTCVSRGAQFEEQPGYYLLQALAQWVSRPTTVETQVGLARLVSCVLAVAVAALTWWAAQEFQPGNTLLAVLSTTLLGLIITYVDLMAALNNDVAAIAAVSLVCVVGISILRRGLTLMRALLMLAAVVCCLFAKTSSYIGLPLAVFCIVLRGWPSFPRWLKWVMPLLMLVSLAAIFDLHVPADWQISSVKVPSSRSANAADRQWAFHIEQGMVRNAFFWQALSPHAIEALKGQPVTVGAWVRTSGTATQVPLPQLTTANKPLASASVQANGTWIFFAYHTQLPSNLTALEIQLPGKPGEVVEYDGVILAVGERPLDVAPTFDDSTGQIALWGNNRTINWVRNGSAESGWWMVRSPINRLLPWGGVNYRLQSYYDWSRTWPQYVAAFTWQFVTFWAAYGNGIPALPSPGIALVAVLTGLMGFGLAMYLVKSYRQQQLAGWQWRIVIFLAAVVATALIMSLLRIDPVSQDGKMFYIPTARHFYVAIMPTALLMMLGWLYVWPPKLKRYAAVVLVLGLYGLSVWSLLNVQLPYFHIG